MTKIWQKDANSTANKVIEQYTVGNDYILDMKLIAYDIRATKAHATMLQKIGILEIDELTELSTGLDVLASKVEDGSFSIDVSQEDCHTAIEAFLIQNYGEVGKKIHTGRSRNDQILITLRLYTLDKIEILGQKIKDFIQVIDKKCVEIGAQDIPGYTHTQKAMPSSVGDWLGMYKDCMQDVGVLLDSVREVNSQNPLGSAAGYGDAGLGLDRDYTTELLGLKKVQHNPLYCAYSRGKFEYMLLQVLSHVMLDIGKLANELVYFSSSEFDFFTLPESFKTGSSIMPQKKNWDIMELVRAHANLFLGYEFQLREVYKMLFMGYNRDFQLTKEPYLKAIQLVEDTLDVMILTTESLGINTQVLDAAMTPELYATQEAYDLVKAGMPFRDAYREVGKKYM